MGTQQGLIGPNLEKNVNVVVVVAPHSYLQ